MRGVKRSEVYEEIVRRLAETPHRISGRSLFPTMRELMCFAAVVGFEHERRKPVEGKTNEIDGRIFQNQQQAIDLLYLIALTSTKDVEILREEREDEMITIFEEYANGGLEVIRQWLLEKSDDIYGDKALLAALSKYGFLQAAESVEAAIDQVKF